jgi:hypothetical protein
MIDGYTRIVLTVIAVALGALALQGLIPAANAAPPGVCGSRHEPCFVTFARYYGEPIDVRVVP